VRFGVLRTFVPCRQTHPFFQLLRPQPSRYFFAVANFGSHRFFVVPCGTVSARLNTALSPQLNLHKARVRRNHGRPPPNDFTGRAQNSAPPFTPHRERASGKALTFLDNFRLADKPGVTA
jgi:hypothetical protein